MSISTSFARFFPAPCVYSPALVGADDYAGAGEGTVDLAVCTTDRVCHHGTDMQHDGTGGAGSAVPPPPPTPTGTWCTMTGYGGNAAVGSLCADTDGDGTPGPCTPAPGDIYGPHGAAHSLALLSCVLHLWRTRPASARRLVQHRRRRLGRVLISLRPSGPAGPPALLLVHNL